MALKEDGDLIKRTVTFDKSIFNKFNELAASNKEANKKIDKKKCKKAIDTTSQLIRDAMKKYLEPSEFQVLERYTKKELRNYLSIEEATLIVSALKNTSYDVCTVSPKIVLLSNIRDSIDLDRFDELFNVDGNSIIKKIDNLSEFQSFILIKNVFEFWDSCKDINDVNAEDNIKRIFFIS